MNRSFNRYHLLPLCIYTLIAVIYTWPVAAHLTTHIPGHGDAPWFLWQFWWFKHALLDLRQLPYTTDLIYYPLQDVPVMAQTPVNETLMLPLLVATNLTLFYNLLFFLSYTLSGYFIYLLGRALGCRPAIAFVGGVIFAFCAYRGIRGLGHISLLTTQWMPLSLLLALQCWRRPTVSRGLALGVATALVALSSPYYIGLFLLPVVLVGGLVLLTSRSQGLVCWPRWQAALIAGAVAAILVVPLYAHYLFLDADIYTMTSELGRQTATNSADLLSWLLPSGLNALWGRYTAPVYRQFTTPNLMETTLFVGFVPLALFLASWFITPSSAVLRFWQSLAFLTMVLALGPTLHVNGHALWAGLPYHWLLLLPGFDSFRIPSRAGITTALALSVIAMLVAQRISRQRAFTWCWQWGLGLFVVVYLINVSPFYPHPLTDTRVPAIYDALAEVAEDRALVELPAGEYFSNGYNYFASVSMWMAYQHVHQRRTVSGYLGRRPARLHTPERTLPFVQRFFNDNPGQIAVAQPDLSLLPATEWPADIRQAATLLADEGIGAVALHCAPRRAEEFCQAAIDLLNEALGLPVAVEGIHRLYRVMPPRYQSHDLPPQITELTPQFDQAFAPVSYTPGRRTHLLDKAGSIRVVVPLAGTWAVQGLFTGEQLDQVQLWVDGERVKPAIDRYTATAYGWRLEIAWTSGLHTLTIQLPAAVAAEQHTAAACSRLCLHNFSIRLAEPSTAQSATERSATFVNEQGQMATLLQITLLTSPRPTTGAKANDPPLTWVMTTWQLDQTLQAQLQLTQRVLPTLFVHLSDSSGTVITQADHPLGQRYLLAPERALLYDFVPLPPLTDHTVRSARIGLWYPATAHYFWQPVPANAADPASVQIGPLHEIDQSVLH